MKQDWLELWIADKQSMVDTMVRNMVADLNAGYDYYGRSITRQRETIEGYKKEFDLQMKALGLMDQNKVQHWCYMDLKRRGAIA